MQGDEPVKPSNLVVAHRAALDVSGRLAEDGLVMLAVLLLANELGILFLLGPPAALSSRTALSGVAFLGLDFVLLVLAINLVENFANAGVGVGFDEMAKQVGQAQEVAEPPDGIILLPELDLSHLRVEGEPWTRLVCSAFCQTRSSAAGSPRSDACGRPRAEHHPLRYWLSCWGSCRSPEKSEHMHPPHGRV
jgi:hypothetical protein